LTSFAAWSWMFERHHAPHRRRRRLGLAQHLDELAGGQVQPQQLGQRRRVPARQLERLVGRRWLEPLGDVRRQDVALAAGPGARPAVALGAA